MSRWLQARDLATTPRVSSETGRCASLHLQPESADLGFAATVSGFRILQRGSVPQLKNDVLLDALMFANGVSA